MDNTNARTILQGRYELGRQVDKCGETVVYLGRDLSDGKHVTIREFFCDAIMRRDENGVPVVADGKDVLYKSLLADYEELCRYLMNLPEGYPVLRPFEISSENNTVYSLEGYAGAERLGDYMARQKKVMSWPKLKRMITPLIKLLGKIHSDGVYHRGISPETLLVTGDETLLLTDFCIPAARTAGSEIESTLYFGYSSPEQYSSNSWQGSWSDVYSLAAVCYRALTGVIPVEWRQRGSGRELPAPIDIKPDIPQNVSDALLKALNVELSLRYRTVEEFWCDLLVEQGGGTLTYSLPVEVRTSQPAVPENVQISSHSLLRQPMVIALIVISCVAIFSLALAYQLVNVYFTPVETVQPPASSESVSSQPQEEAPPQEVEIVMPNMVGENIEKILLDPLYQKLFVFEMEWVFSESMPAGSVTAQQPKPGEKPNSSGQTYLWVSKGSELLLMPNIVGLSLEEALRILDMSEIGYTIKFVEVDEEQELQKSETVIQTSIEAGNAVRRSSDTVVITVAQKHEDGEGSSDEGTGIDWSTYVFTMPPRKQTYWPPPKE